MPQLGETVAEGKITKWFKSAGDAVKPGDNLFEIETDKVSMEVPSTTAGVLAEIRVPAGEVAPVGAVVAVIADGAGAAAGAVASRRRLEPSPPPPASAPTSPAAARGRRAVAPHAAGARRRPIKLDPFFEVRTPERNYGPARSPAAPASRRWRGGSPREARHRPRAASRRSGPHGRIVARDVEAALARSAARGARRCAGAGVSADAGQGALPRRRRSRRCRSTACAGPSPRG